MVYSMTGYGEAQHETEAFSFLVEIKSLNNRFLKSVIKLPDVLAFAEPEVEKIIRQELARGSVTFTLHMRHKLDVGPVELNAAALNHYTDHLQRLLNLYDESAMTVDLANLLNLPGVCVARQYSQQEHEFFLEVVQDLTRQAIARLREMRGEEGKSLQEDLNMHCEVIRGHLEALSGLTDGVVDRYRQRIQERVNQMLTEVNLKLDEDQLAREVALFAERCDVNEEIMRLGSHLQQFKEVSAADGQAGRRLDFITQEMLREANTIASKANDATISQHIVEVKVAIDRLKEQVQNVE